MYEKLHLEVTAKLTVPQFLVSQNQSLVGAGISILPGTTFVPITAIIGSLIISKLQKFRTINSIAWLFVVVGFSLMTQLKVHSNKAMQYGFQVIYAVGAGVVRDLLTFRDLDLTNLAFSW
jgi:hypothetical protein